jgi:hypothetical protein
MAIAACISMIDANPAQVPSNNSTWEDSIHIESATDTGGWIPQLRD